MPGDARRWSNAAVWRWKHVDNPFGRSLVLLAQDDATGRITGLRAFMAWQYLVAGRPTLAYNRWTRHDRRAAGGIFHSTPQRWSARMEGGLHVWNTPNHKINPCTHGARRRARRPTWIRERISLVKPAARTLIAADAWKRDRS
jgi:hypothetical protein